MRLAMLLFVCGLLACSEAQPACLDAECQGVGGAGGSSGSSGTAGSSGSDPATTYCDCMLTACHDEYHATFGPETDEVAARENCLAQAALVPVAGSSVTQGDFIECRIHHCEIGRANASACPGSIGEDNCQ